MNRVTVLYYKERNDFKPIPLAERAKVYACSRSLAGIVRPNPGGGIDGCLL
jgi:hypothetical protein